MAALPAEIGLVAIAPPGLGWADGALDALRAAAARHPAGGHPGGPASATRTARPCRRRTRCPAPGRGVVAVLRGAPWPPTAPADPADEGPVGWSSAPALLLRRAALDSVDGFDPRYPGRLDDLDLADRLAAAGWLTVHVPSATVVCVPAARSDAAAARSDAAAARRYLADRTPRPVGALLRTSA